MRTTLTMTGTQHELLRAHLFPGDGLEAVALMLCGRCETPGLHRLLVHQVVPVPHSECHRAKDRVTWPTSRLKDLLEQAAGSGLAVAKIHSHPDGLAAFSPVDDAADAELFSSVAAAVDDGRPHLSAIMLPDGRVIARAHDGDGGHGPLDQVAVIGDDLHFWHCKAPSPEPLPEFALRHAQAFGRGTFERLRRLRVAVVGCSGTGSVVVDQLARLGVGRIVLVDPDRVEEKNLNRIVNAVRGDVGRLKVEVLGDFIQRLGLGTAVEALPLDLSDPAALRAVAACDVAFGCMDSVDGRDLLNRLATFHLLAYFDVGVRLDADGQGGIDQICGSAHYVQPGRSSLRTRGVYTDADLEAAALRRSDPAAYAEKVRRGYLRGVDEDRPAVNAVNALFSSLAVIDFLLRLHPGRIDPNGDFAAQTMSLTAGLYLQAAERGPDEALLRHVGRGDMSPPLGRPYLDMLRRRGS
ncbi:ThiF family adenylyltransferase [Microvirga soli]|uniref:ThiF family adenylyltransferase n=1 Tax=Microvirga soli TaxID=1854496 RepID=UPI0019200510|nr:ThiF family adenylyltransferase [Microvirga soli]